MAESQASAGRAQAAAATDGGSSEDRGRASVLFIGDVVGGIGRRTLLESLPVLRERYEPTFVIVNGENVAGGLGITPKLAGELIAAGIVAMTLGNPTYHRRVVCAFMDTV